MDKEEEEGTKEGTFLEWHSILNGELESKELKFKENELKRNYLDMDLIRNYLEKFNYDGLQAWTIIMVGNITWNF